MISVSRNKWWMVGLTTLLAVAGCGGLSGLSPRVQATTPVPSKSSANKEQDSGQQSQLVVAEEKGIFEKAQETDGSAKEPDASEECLNASPMPSKIELDCTGIAPGKMDQSDSQSESTMPSAGVRDAEAATLFSHFLLRCPQIEIAPIRYIPGDHDLFFRQIAGGVDLVEYQRGWSVDGVDSIVMTRVNSDTCEWYRITKESMHQQLSGPICFQSSLGQSAKTEIFDTMAKEMGFGWGSRYVSYTHCDSSMGSQVIKASRMQFVPGPALKSLDDVYQLSLELLQIPHRIHYSGKPTGGPAVYFRKSDLPAFIGVNRIINSGAERSGGDSYAVLQTGRERSTSGCTPSSEIAADGALVEGTDKPLRVYRAARFEIFQTSFRVRRGANLVAVYNKKNNTHLWAGMISGVVKWHYTVAGFLFGEVRPAHPIFYDDYGFVILDLENGDLYRMKVNATDSSGGGQSECARVIQTSGNNQTENWSTFPRRRFSFDGQILTVTEPGGCGLPIKIDWLQFGSALHSYANTTL